MLVPLTDRHLCKHNILSAATAPPESRYSGVWLVKDVRDLQTGTSTERRGYGA